MLPLLEFVSLFFTLLRAYARLGELLAELFEPLGVLTLLKVRLTHRLLSSGKFVLQALAVTSFAHVELLAGFFDQAGHERIVGRDQGTSVRTCVNRAVTADESSSVVRGSAIGSSAMVVHVAS